MANEHTIQLLEKDIQEAKNCLDGGNDEEVCKSFESLNTKYGEKYDVTVKIPLICYGNSTIDCEYKEYMEQLIGNLELVLAELKDKKEGNKDNAISIINNNSNVANSIINQNFDFKTTIEYINEIPDGILDEQLKTELRSILTEIECANEKEGKKEKFGKLLKWFGEKIADAGFNKFIDYIPNILSYLAKITF